MIVQSYPNPKEAEDHDSRPALRLEKSLRDLIQEEMGLARAATQRPIASRIDAFWLFLCVADAALLLWLLPEAMLGDKRLELFGKLLTWLGGSLFVLGYVWFRELFLAFVRHRSFKAVLVGLPFILVPLYITQMDIFPIQPVIEPRNAKLEIDGRPFAADNLKVSLRHHKVSVKLQIGEEAAEKPTVYERDFPLTVRDVWRSWWSDEQPYWPLKFYVPVDFTEVAESIELIKEDGNIDQIFRGSTPLVTIEKDGEKSDRSGKWTQQGAMLFEWPYEPGAGYVGLGFNLPYGNYRLTANFADKQGCEKSTVLKITVNPGSESKLKSVTRKCS